MNDAASSRRSSPATTTSASPRSNTAPTPSCSNSSNSTASKASSPNAPTVPTNRASGPALWQKYRLNLQQEFVIGGYTRAAKGFDALIIGFYRGKDLVFAAR